MHVQTKAASCYLAMALAVFIVTPAVAADDRVAVTDKEGLPVRSNQFSNCVRADINKGEDVCAPPPAPTPVVQYVPPPQPTKLSTEQRTIYFDFNKTAITPDSAHKLDDAAAILRTAKDVRSTLIVGYADRIGTNSYNMSLSRKRAEAVKKYLADHGYVNTATELRAMGKEDSRTPCDPALSRVQTIACLGPDRRVELEVQYASQ
jgi:OOP family OmpA-OmpF porin